MAQVGLLEDNTRIANLCATMLQYAGHQVKIYGHPRECLDALLLEPVISESRPYSHKSAPSPALPVDVLILDLNLPDIPGLDVVNSLRASPRTQSLPLIFCTAASPSDIIRALRVAPSASFLEKPFTFQQLTSVITSALNPLKK
jgi:CheY-like chemotaxis protein